MTNNSNEKTNGPIDVQNIRETQIIYSKKITPLIWASGVQHNLRTKLKIS